MSAYAHPALPYFLDVQPSLENHWRALMLFGRSVAFYKFALGKAPFEERAVRGDLMRLGNPALPYTHSICEHLHRGPRQAISASSRFLEACSKAKVGELSEDKLRDLTVSLAFNNVIDAFHGLRPSDICRRFFVEERRIHGGIRLTDEFEALGEIRSPDDLTRETKAHSRLVKTAWEGRTAGCHGSAGPTWHPTPTTCSR